MSHGLFSRRDDVQCVIMTIVCIICDHELQVPRMNHVRQRNPGQQICGETVTN